MANRQFVLYTLDQPKQEELRVGLSVSKKSAMPSCAIG